MIAVAYKKPSNDKVIYFIPLSQKDTVRKDSWGVHLMITKGPIACNEFEFTVPKMYETKLIDLTNQQPRKIVLQEVQK